MTNAVVIVVVLHLHLLLLLLITTVIIIVIIIVIITVIMVIMVIIVLDTSRGTLRSQSLQLSLQSACWTTEGSSLTLLDELVAGSASGGCHTKLGQGGRRGMMGSDDALKLKDGKTMGLYSVYNDAHHAIILVLGKTVIP